MRNLLFAVVVLLVLGGCGGQKADNRASFDEEQAIAGGEKVIAAFQGALKQELMTAMADGGPENAIAVCHIMAPQIADSFSAMPGIHIQRVSLRQRNIGFSPDSFETAVLEKFAGDNAVEPESFGELTFDSAGVRHFRYMKEIKTGGMCLRCHGDPAEFSPGLKAALAQYYPDDPAVGYTLGQSRGAFSVTITYPEAEPSLTKLLNTGSE
jgi:hypothetical protein